MQLLTLLLRDFRNYEEVHLEFSPQLNEICGANAQGKTNLLEAIHLLVIGRSFRTLHLRDLIRLQQPHFYVEATFLKHGVVQTLKLSYDGSERRIVHNSTAYNSFTQLLGLLQGVVFSPEDHALVSGAPTIRRRFLDLHIAQVDPLYVHFLARFYGAMKHRNQLLRQRTELSIESWEHEMAKAAAYLTTQRIIALEQLSRKVLPIQEALSQGHDRLTLRFKTTAPLNGSTSELTQYYQEAFLRHRAREMLFKQTLTGPHRDDFTPLLSEQEARAFGSEGQKMCCVMAMRLAEWQRLYELTGEKPLMMVDDVGACLDETRRQQLYEQLMQAGQLFIASPQRLVRGQPGYDRRAFARLFTVDHGIVRQGEEIT
jgi:DNA replication and repair protein RecF